MSEKMDYHEILLERIKRRGVNYRICANCVMDTSDPEIKFNAQGVCNHCLNFERNIKPRWLPNEQGRKFLLKKVQRIRKDGRGKKYDCVIGVSGGVDSSYLLYVAAKELSLRPLALHVDCGWDSEIAVKNIEELVRSLEIDLYTEVIDWQEMKDLQVAFLKSGVANQDTPQDHAIFASLYRFAVKNNIPYCLTGVNLSTESILPPFWGYDPFDGRHLKAVHKLFGKRQLKSYPIVGFFDLHFYFPFVKRMRIINPFDYMPYVKEEAIEVLRERLGWRYYGGKHYESRFTKFFQGFYLPARFGYDKRRAHLSSQIVSGQLSRQEALKALEEDPYPKEELSEDTAFLLKKLGLTEEELARFLFAPLESYKKYPAYRSTLWFWFLRKLFRFYNLFRNKYYLVRFSPRHKWS